MKKIIKGYILGFLTAALLIGGTVYATQKVKIVINGAELIPTDATGKVVEPLLVDGTTYLPVRAIAQALGLDVEWEDKTYTVKIKEIKNKDEKDDKKEEKNDDKKPETAVNENVIEGIGQITTNNIQKEQSTIRDEKSGEIYTVDGLYLLGDWGNYRIIDGKLEYFKPIDHYGWEKGKVEKSRYTSRFGMNEFEIKLTDGTILKAAPKLRVNEYRYKIDDSTINMLENITHMIDGKEICYFCYDDGTVLKIETIK